MASCASSSEAKQQILMRVRTARNIAEDCRAPAYDNTVTEEAPDGALGAARTLALTRIVAGFIILVGGDVQGAVRFAGVDPALVSPPSGSSWLRALDLSPWAATALTWIVVVAALLG